MGEVVMSCKYGTITKIVDDNKAIGINHAKLTDLTPCRVDTLKDGPFKNKECSDTIAIDKVIAHFEKVCVGKKDCDIDIFDPEKKEYLKDFFPGAKDNKDCY